MSASWYREKSISNTMMGRMGRVNVRPNGLDLIVPWIRSFTRARKTYRLC